MRSDSTPTKRRDLVELRLHRGNPLELDVKGLPMLLDCRLEEFDERFELSESIRGALRRLRRNTPRAIA